jgi:transcriptional regulator with XRE-family HTH domain
MTPEEFKASLAQLGWKQSDFCAKAGVERNTPSRWSNGHTPIPEWVPAFLCAMLDIQQLHAKYIDPRTRVDDDEHHNEK